MDLELVWVVLGIIGLMWLIKRMGLISRNAALVHLNQGAMVIDVRTPGEFQSGHIEGAINVPMNELGGQIGQHAPNKEQVLLLHCLSGTRSGMAKGILKGMGYPNVFNLGSYFRAKSIVQAGRKPD